MSGINGSDALPAEEALYVAGLFSALAAHTDDEAAMAEIGARYIGEHVGDMCTVRLIDPEIRNSAVVGVWDRDRDREALLRQLLTHGEVPPDASVGAAVLRTLEPLIVNDIDLEGLRERVAQQFLPYIARLDVGAFGFYPIAARGGPIGYVCIARSRARGPFSAVDVALVDEVVRRLSVLLAHARLLAVAEEGRRRVEESEQRVRAILEESFDVVAVVGVDGRMLYVSPSVEFVLGVHVEEWAGAWALDLVHPDDQERVLRVMRAVRSGEERARVEYRLRAGDGRWRDVEATIGGRVTIDGQEGVVISARDVTERVAAEQGQRLLAAIVESSDDAITSFDADGNATSWNPAAERLFRISAAHALGSSMVNFVPHDGREELRKGLERLLRGEGIRQIQTVLLRADGSTIPVSVTAWPLFDSAARVVGYAAITRDMTERLEAEHRLRQSEEFFRAVFEGAPVGVAVMRADGDLIRANVALAALCGRQTRELVRGGWLKVIHPDDRPTVIEHFRAVLAARATIPLEYRIITSAGDVRRVEATATLVEGSGALSERVIAHVQDVSARHDAEISLLHRVAEQACVAQIGAAALVESSLSGLARTAAELTARTLGDATVAVTPVGDPAAFDAVAVTVGTPAATARPLRVAIPAPGRTIGFLEATVAESSGEADHVSVFLDAVASMLAAAAERRALEEQLAAAQRVQDIGALAGSVAHDFNNLLTVVLGSAEVVRDRVGRDPVSVAGLDRVLDAGERAAGLVRQLSAFGRQQALVSAPVDLASMVTAFEPVLRSLLGGDVELSVEAPPRGLAVGVERTNLEQILVNLVVNARDALDGTGRIEISIKHEQRASRDGAVVVVADDGPGMTAAVAASCFTPFFTTKSHGKGTGLGLPTVHRIVTQAGGEVDVVTAPGKGASFRVWLPLDSRPVQTEVTRVGGDTGGNELVLVAEDEAPVRALLTKSLVAGGYSVLVAEDGEAAAKLAQPLPERVDLLVTDVAMPKMGGVELAERLRERWADLPVLFITGHAPDEAKDAPDEALSSVLRKPFTPSQFLREVRRSLDAAALQR